MMAVNDFSFQPGKNIAMKVHQDVFDDMVYFYKHLLLLEVQIVDQEHASISRSAKVEFGHNILWIDSMRNNERTRIYLELHAGHFDKAVQYLQINGVEFCDDIEQIPENMHWIKDPAGNVILIKKKF